MKPSLKWKVSSVHLNLFTRSFPHIAETYKLLRHCLPSQQMLVPRTSRGRPPPTSTGRLLKTLFDYPRHVLNWRCGGVSKTSWWRLWKHVLGRCGVICWKSPNFFLFNFWNLLDWPNISGSNSILKVYLESSRTTKMELLHEIG